METLRKILVAALLAALLLLSGVVIGRRSAPAPETAGTAVPDTLRFRDTVFIDRPAPLEVMVVDTMLVAVTDTVTVNDTVYLSLPRETKLYGDSTWRAQVSGFRPSLDWIEVYPQTTVVTKTFFVSPRKRWGLGLQAGYGAYVSGGQVMLAPYIGVGISYDLIRF